jgi:hypothetical protein
MEEEEKDVLPLLNRLELFSIDVMQCRSKRRVISAVMRQRSRTDETYGMMAFKANSCILFNFRAPL